MATDFPFYDEQPGPEIREKLNELFALWEGAIGNVVKGDAGWAPLIRAATSGNKVALQLYDWTGGEGAKPTVTGYLGPAGYVATIADAIDFRGPVGLTGPANTLAMGTVTTGAPGSAASATVTGTAPNQTLNLTIPRGDVGAPNTLAIGTVETVAPEVPAAATITGAAPNQTLNLVLPKGNTGNTGPVNTLAIGTVATGDSGEPAEASITGEAPNQTLNLMLPRGAGGTPGAAATITVGTVTTGAPGTAASVENVGTPTAAVFDIVIPRGEAGDGDGDMTKAVYDPTNSGSVTHADAVPWDGVENKPVLFGGSETFLVVAIQPPAAAAAPVTIGEPIPSNLTGALWTSGQLVGTTGTQSGTVYRVLADGTKEIAAQRFTDSAGNTSFDRYLIYWNSTVLYRVREGVVSSATITPNTAHNIWLADRNVDSAIGPVSNLTTVNKSSLTDAINELQESKQQTLTSGQNLKTVNGVDILGTGNAVIQWRAVDIPESADLDNYQSEGAFVAATDVVAASLSNSPATVAFSLRVWKAAGVIQEVTEFSADNSRKTYQRAFALDAWSDWARFYTTLDVPEMLIRAPSPGSPNELGRTGVAIAEFRAENSPVGAIAFSAPNDSAAGLYLLSILGHQYSQRDIFDETVVGYRSEAGVWTQTRRKSSSTKALKVRFATGPLGAATVIIGDIDTVWSYPHFTLMTAMLSEPIAATPHLQGWTTALLTDLTGYSSVTADMPVAPTTAAVSVVVPTEVPAFVDLNNYATPGDYYVPNTGRAETIANIPETLPGSLEVKATSSTGLIQTYTTYWENANRKIYQRARLPNGTWGTWTRTYTQIDPPPVVSSILKFAYADRAELRTSAGEFAMVDMLGLFEFDLSSTLADDDESVFATADGRWVLRCPSFDLIEAWNLPRNSMLGRVISGWINCSVTSVAANSFSAVISKIPGVEPGDSVSVTPPAPLGTTAAATSALNFYAYCPEVGTVSLIITNPTATVAPLQARVQTNWPVTVVKAN